MDEQREAVRKMQDYIREHIQEDIRIEDLAEVSAFSAWHARRLFQKYLHMSPYHRLPCIFIGSPILTA